MATQTPTTGSQAIRDYLAAHGDAKPKEIKEELAKQGFDVSNALIQKVKHRWAQSRGNGQAKRKNQPAAKTQRKMTKSQAIREHLSRHPDASRSETAAAVAKRLGVKVSPKDVSQTKYEMKKQTGSSPTAATASGTAAKRGTGKKAQAPAMEGAVDDLVAAKTLAERLGGIDRAKHTLDLLAKLS